MRAIPRPPPRTRTQGRASCCFSAASTAQASIHEAERHHETQILGRVARTLRLQGRGALGRLEREADFVGRDVAEDLQQVARVEADVERVAGVANRELVLRLAEVRRLDVE